MIAAERVGNGGKIANIMKKRTLAIAIVLFSVLRNDIIVPLRSFRRYVTSAEL